MRLLARRRVHGELQVHPRPGQLARRIHQLAVLLAFVKRAAEHPHPAPQVRRLHRVVVDVPGHALLTRLGRGGQADRSVAHAAVDGARLRIDGRSEEHTSELQSLMRISYAVLRFHKKTPTYFTCYRTCTG